MDREFYHLTGEQKTYHTRRVQRCGLPIWAPPFGWRHFYDVNACASRQFRCFQLILLHLHRPLTMRTDLRGGPVSPSFQIDWARFFNRDPAHPPQKAKRIEPLLNTLLLDLPNGVVPANVTMPPLRSLATRNLLRSEALMVPSGQDVARALGAKCTQGGRPAQYRAHGRQHETPAAVRRTTQRMLSLVPICLPRPITILPEAIGWEKPRRVCRRNSSSASSTPTG